MRLDPKVRAGVLIAGLAATFGAMYWVERGSDMQAASAERVVGVAERRAARAPDPASFSETARAAGSAPGLDLSRLQRARSSGPSRDPFANRSFKPAPVQRAELPPSAPVQAAPPLSPPPPPPSAPPLPFTYLGRLSEENRTTAFLTAGDRNFVVKPGDVIDNNYRVDDVNDKAVLLTYLPLNIKQTVSTGAQ